MELFRLEDLVKRIKVGFVGPINKFYCSKSEGVPMIRTTDLTTNGVDFSNLKYVTNEFHEKHKKSQLKNGDLIIARHGDNGKANLFKENFEAQVLNAVIIEPNQDKLSSEILMLYFDSVFVKKQILGCVKGSVQGVINTSHIANLQIPISTTINLTKVLEIIKPIDTKTELNNKINAELEAMAKLVYDYWFVQFDFPTSAAYAASVGKPELEGQPYKSSGGKMEYNEELKREIPEGWEQQRLGNVLEHSKTGLNPRKNFKLGEGSNFYVTIKNIKQGKVILDSKCDLISDEALEIINERSDLKIGDILFTSIQPVGVTYLIKEKPENWNINESVFTLRANYKLVTSEFLFMFLSGDYIKAYTNNVSAGSIHKGVRHGTLKDCLFVLPPKNIVNEFSKIIESSLDQIHTNQKQNQELASLRDWLLPMLMNGQVTVGDAEEKVAKMSGGGG